MKFDFNESEVRELKAALSGRLRELDKAMKTTLKAGLTSASEKVMDSVTFVRALHAIFSETEN